MSRDRVSDDERDERMKRFELYASKMAESFNTLGFSMSQTARAFQRLVLAMDDAMDKMLEALTPEQRFLYEQLVAGGAYKIDAIKEARRLNA